jgi:hypothetical protein
MNDIEGKTRPRLERALFRVLWLLRDYLADLVVIGGWIPYLYAHFGGEPWDGTSSLTGELDILVVPPLHARDRPRLDDALREAGLTPERTAGPAAVWSAPVESGEMIEFLTPHTGTATKQGTTVSVAGHGIVGAIGLNYAAVLAAHTTTLVVPVGQYEGRLQHVNVIVPRLGAYLINKAATFTARQPDPDGQNPRQAKDLVYIHDVLAAGAVIRRRVETEIRVVRSRARSRRGDRQTITTAQNNLGLALRGAIGIRLLPAAAKQLAERDNISVLDAEARIRGFLADLEDTLTEIRRSR